MPKRITEEELMCRYRERLPAKPVELAPVEAGELVHGVAPRICPQCDAEFDVPVVGVTTGIKRFQLCDRCAPRLPEPKRRHPRAKDLEPPRRADDRTDWY